MRILIVEDDLQVSEVLQLLCEDEGHEHRSAQPHSRRPRSCGNGPPRVSSST